jgi:hypothetical protein
LGGALGLGLAPVALHQAVQRVAAPFGLRLQWETARELFVARIESGCPSLLIVDTDLMGCLSELCSFARSVRPDVRVLGLTCYWSERDEALAACADAVLHKPLRQAQWEAVFARLGLSRGAMPALAAC